MWSFSIQLYWIKKNEEQIMENIIDINIDIKQNIKTKKTATPHCP